MPPRFGGLEAVTTEIFPTRWLADASLQMEPVLLLCFGKLDW